MKKEIIVANNIDNIYDEINVNVWNRSMVLDLIKHQFRE